jgi:hypothetical protein
MEKVILTMEDKAIEVWGIKSNAEALLISRIAKDD